MRQVGVRSHIRSGRAVRPHLRIVRYSNGRIGGSLFLRGPGDSRIAEVFWRPYYHGDPTEFVIDNVYVDPAMRRRGYGAEAIRQAEKEMRSRGARTIYLSNVLPDAWPFWEARGYRRSPFTTEDTISRFGDTWMKRVGRQASDERSESKRLR